MKFVFGLFVVVLFTGCMTTNSQERGPAGQYRLIKVCSSPPNMEGEFKVYLSSDKTSAVVSYSGTKEYPVDAFYLGPVSNFDFKSEVGQERIIIAVDGGHELHKMMPNGKYQKVLDLNCY